MLNSAEFCSNNFQYEIKCNLSIVYNIIYNLNESMFERIWLSKLFWNSPLIFFWSNNIDRYHAKEKFNSTWHNIESFCSVFFCLLYFWGFLLGLCWIWDNLKYLKHYELVISPGFFPHSCKRFTMIVYRHHSITWNFDPFTCKHIYKCNNACEIHFHFFLTEVINTFTKTNVDRKHSVKITPVTIIQYYFYW